MSDKSNPTKVEANEELQCLEDNNYFAEQDKKFAELNKKLQELKEENKKQIDIVINSLDQLLADKCVIEKTLEQAEHLNESIKLPILEDKNMSVVELLSKVTGFIESSENESISRAALLDEMQQDVENHKIELSNLIKYNEKNNIEFSEQDCDKKNKSEFQEKIFNIEDLEIMTDSIESLENICIVSKGPQKSDGIC